MGKEQELIDAARNGDHAAVDRILSLRLKKNNPLASLRKTPGPNTQDASGYTCLHHAALNGHRKVVEILLEYDANVNLVDCKGSTCLHLAAWRGNTDIVVSILVKSAFQPNVNQQNNDQETPLHCAAQFGHSAVCTLLLQHGADAGIRNFRRETALDLACEYGRFESAEVIIRLRPELLSRDLIPIHSPLHLAAKNGHSSVVKMLLNSGFNVNYVTQNGSALHEASFYGKFDVVSILLNYGIDIHLMNHNGRTVLDLLAELNTVIAKQIERTIQDHLLQAEIEAQNEQQMLDEQQQQVMWQCISPPPSYCDDQNPLQEPEVTIFNPLSAKLISQTTKSSGTTSSSIPAPSSSSSQKFAVYDRVGAKRASSRQNHSSNHGESHMMSAAVPTTAAPPDSSGLSSPANSEFSYCEFVKPPLQFQPNNGGPHAHAAAVAVIAAVPPPSVQYHHRPTSSSSSMTQTTEHAYFTLPKKPPTDDRPFSAGITRFHSGSSSSDAKNSGCSRSQECMLDDLPMYSMRSSESIYASTDPTSSLDQQPQSLPVFSAASPAVSCRAGDVSVGGLAQNTFYCQPNSAKSLHNLHRPPPIPSKPPRKLSERGLPLEHSRSVHQLHQPNIRPAAEPISVWSVAPVRRSNSNCSDRAVWRETNSMHNSNLPPQPVYSHLSNQASSVDMTSTPSANRHSSLPGQQTLRRFQVHCGDVYAQVDKSRKVTKSSSGKAGARHQRSKSEHTSNSADDDVEPIYSTIGRSSSKTASPDTAPVRIGEKRKKRATITIPLQVRSFDLDLNGKDAANNSTPPPPPPPLPPAPSHVEALPLIQKVCKQLRHDYKRERRKVCKQSETNEADFSDLLQTRNDEIVVLRNDEPDRWRHVDVGIGTDQAEDDEYIEAEEEAEDEGEEAEEAEEEEEKIKQEKKQNVVHCHKELKEIPAPKSFGNLTVDNDQFELNSNHNSFVQMLRNQKNNRRRSSDDTAFQGLYHGSTGAKNVARPQRGLLRKSKTSVDARDFQIKKHRHRSDFEKSDQKERRRLHSLIKMLDEDSINRNNTCGMRLFQFASENQLQEMHSIENVGRYERNTFPRFLPAQTFDEKSEWNDIIRIFDTFEKKLYDGLVTKHSPSDEHLNRSPQPESGVKSTGQCPDEAVIVCRSTDSVRKRQLKKYSRRSCERISVEFWLASLQLIQYCDVLHNNGFDNLKFMGPNVMDEDDLLEIGVFNKEHRKLLLEAATCLPKLQCYKFHNRKIEHWSVGEWLKSLDLSSYAEAFAANGYVDMERVRRLGQLQLIDLLDMQKLGHRKRVIASLDQRNCAHKDFDLIDVDLNNIDFLSRKLDQLLKENDEGIGGSSTTDLQSESASMPPDDHDQDSNDLIRSTGHEEYDQILAKSKKKDDLIDQPSDFDQTPSSQLIVDWKHDPIELYKSTCHYVAFYLGSTSIEHLQGLKSSEQSMRQLRRMLSQNQIGKVPAVIISISYKGVRFIDVLNNKIICEHEIRNVHFACQDMDDFKCFAYITKDHDKQNYYCHVFSAFNLDMANEILLTLGQAFEIAYRLEIGETIDSLRKLYIRSKLTKSIVDPPARLSSDVRSSGHTLSESQFNMAFRAASHTLFRTRRDDGRRHSSGSSAPVNVKHANAHSDRVRVSDTDGSNADSIDLKLIGEPRIAMNPARSSGREKPAVPIKPPHIHHHQHHALHANSHHLFYPHGTSPSGSEAGKPRAK